MPGSDGTCVHQTLPCFVFVPVFWNKFLRVCRACDLLCCICWDTTQLTRFVSFEDFGMQLSAMVNCHVVANRMSIIYVTDIICVAIRYWFLYKNFSF